ncbi:CASP-like protein 3A1 isoform X2 [Andrographis paniculata]|nr:CASP-like protein 3A1 isoform X2 [Andrographis paniculata]XP_051135871.1 CASP-like protein 3A1 isoform X2 [Andrographis paniculata]XP_051135872.1 CASP-like protein 3A1 isoform X2 [Andrographis paniculata]
MTNAPEVTIQLPEAKTAAAESGPLVSEASRRSGDRRKADVTNTVVRILCFITSVTALSVMTTAKQASTISLYGFSMPIYSKWSFSDSFEYLVGVSAAVAVHSMLQLLINLLRIHRGYPVIPSRNHAWLIFGGDQIFAYSMMSAGSAASGVTNLNRTGIHHSALPNFCKPLQLFCDRVAVSISFAFLTCFLLAVSVVLDVVWLSKY